MVTVGFLDKAGFTRTLHTTHTLHTTESDSASKTCKSSAGSRESKTDPKELDSNMTDASYLELEGTAPSRSLATGQLWKVRGGYIEIGIVGNRLAHYKIFYQRDQKATVTRIMKIGALLSYLDANEAALVNDPG